VHATPYSGRSHRPLFAVKLIPPRPKRNISLSIGTTWPPSIRGFSMALRVLELAERGSDLGLGKLGLEKLLGLELARGSRFSAQNRRSRAPVVFAVQSYLQPVEHACRWEAALTSTGSTALTCRTRRPRSVSAARCDARLLATVHQCVSGALCCSARPLLAPNPSGLSPTAHSRRSLPTRSRRGRGASRARRTRHGCGWATSSRPLCPR